MLSSDEPWQTSVLQAQAREISPAGASGVSSSAPGNGSSSQDWFRLPLCSGLLLLSFLETAEV